KSWTRSPVEGCRRAPRASPGEGTVPGPFARSAAGRSPAISSKPSSRTALWASHISCICSVWPRGRPSSEPPTVRRSPACQSRRPTATVRAVSYSTEKSGPDAAALVLADVVLDARDAPVQEDEWAALVMAIAEGDQGALRELYEHTHRIVFTLIVRIVKAPATAEEVTLDVYHDVWQRSAAYDRTRGTVVAWIMNIARSRGIDRHRLDHRQKRVDDGTQHVEPIQQPIELADDRRRLLDHALGTLTIDE